MASRCMGPGKCWSHSAGNAVLQCSGSCGGGYRKRIVVCTGVTCNTEDKPVEQDTCNQEPCPAWNVGEWGKV